MENKKVIDKTSFNINNFYKSIKSIGIFLKDVLTFSMDTALKSLNTKAKLYPEVVKMPVDSKSKYKLAFICNTITLKPGTTAFKIQNENNRNYIYVHMIDSKSIKDKQNKKNK